jgi:ribonucleoside-diphosphate reductase beta chain
MKERYTLFPIYNRPIFNLYEDQVKAVWTPYEIDFSEDLKDLKKMKKEERDLILRVLAFFAQSDSIVNENLCLRFMQDVNIPEMLQFYSFQIGIEAIHAHTYALMIDNYVSDTEEKDKLFNAIKNFPTIAQKADWMKKWITSQDNFSKRLLAFALVEGVFFSASFCTIYWFKDRNKLKGLSQANDLINRDESSHVQGASLLYNELLKMDQKIKKNQFILNTRVADLPEADLGKLIKENFFLKKSMLNNGQEFKSLKEEEAYQIVRESVEIEKDFVKDTLRVQLLGINSELMCQYIEHVADLVLVQFGFNKLYNAKQPFDFMIKNDIRGKVNFFEHRSSEYVVAKRESVNFDIINDKF